jgi:hypothetical protein
MKSIPTFEAVIYVGTKDLATGDLADLDHLEREAQNYCDEVGLCVTCDRTTFRYTGGNEPGLVLGLINYPRYPSTVEGLKLRALDLAKLMKREAKQTRLSVKFTDETIMLDEGDENKTT